jgi:uncharacterized protein (TIGR02145 family)
MKKLFFIASVGLLFSCISYAQTVTIGSQVWMTKNLDVSTFRNGDPIPQAKTDEEWERAGENKQPAWCYYDNDEANGDKYGKLYNWYAVNDSRGLAPEGWHVPSDAEWTALAEYLGGEDVAGSKLQSSTDWCMELNGTNELGFFGFPAGYRWLGGEKFANKGLNACWWSSTDHTNGSAYDRTMTCGYGELKGLNGDKRNGQSVRCIKD